MIGCIYGVFFYILANLFAENIRNRGTNVAFTFASSYLGGTAPFIYSYIINHFNLMLFPAGYIAIFGITAFLLSFAI